MAHRRISSLDPFAGDIPTVVDGNISPLRRYARHIIIRRDTHGHVVQVACRYRTSLRAQWRVGLCHYCRRSLDSTTFVEQEWYERWEAGRRARRKQRRAIRDRSKGHRARHRVVDVPMSRDEPMDWDEPMDDY